MAEKSCEDCYEEDLMKCAGCKRKPESAAGEITRPQSRKPLQIQAFSAGEEEQTMPDIKEKLVDILRLKPYNMSEVSAGRLADHLIANGVTIQQWVSVEERLPEENTAVIAATDRGIVFQCWYAYDGWDLWEGNEVTITHWMPIPEPPKGE